MIIILSKSVEHILFHSIPIEQKNEYPGTGRHLCYIIYPKAGSTERYGNGRYRSV